MTLFFFVMLFLFTASNSNGSLDFAEAANFAFVRTVFSFVFLESQPGHFFFVVCPLFLVAGGWFLFCLPCWY